MKKYLTYINEDGEEVNTFYKVMVRGTIIEETKM